VTTHVPTLVVGAGISGLVCGYALRKAGIDAHVIESSATPGGVIRSERRDGYLLEFGPQSFNATSALLNLCRELHIDDQLIQAPPAAPRYVLVKGTLRPVPLSPPAFIASPLFGPVTKLTVLRDILGRSAPPQSDESVASFTRRKFSRDLFDKLVGPFVSGIYAGDPEKLSLRSAFPQLYEAEKSAGSVIRGLLFSTKKRTASAEKPTLQTFRDGNQTLIEALTANLGSKLRCSVIAQRLRLTTASYDTEIDSPIFEVTLQTNDGEELLTTNRLIIATPAQQAANLLREIDPQFESALSAIVYAPVAVVSLGYPKSAVRHALDGFGFLVPRSSGLRILGTVWNSSLFPNRAPDGQVLLTSFVGGATDPDAVSLPESEIVSTVHRELASVLGISQPPSFSHVQAWPRAIPQYNLGHIQYMNQLAQLQGKYQSIRLIGNYLRGPALGACVEQALTVAAEAIKNERAT
jgi:protoporphyrinogen/coproporphyrinogen III oxidase